MEKKNKKKKLYQQWQFWLMIVLIIAIISVIVTWNSEPHFKIYEEVWTDKTQRHYLEVDEIFLGKCKEGFEQADEPSGLSRGILMCYQEICDYIEEINWSQCFSAYDFVVMQRISKEDLTIEWLDGNCEPIKESAVYSKCKEENEIVEVCPIKYFKEYKCEDYIIKIWRQIK